MTKPRGPFRPTTDKLRAVSPSASTRHAALMHALTKITGDAPTASAVLHEALAEYGADEMPEDDVAFSQLVRGYVVPRALEFGSVSAIEAMLTRMLA